MLKINYIRTGTRCPLCHLPTIAVNSDHCICLSTANCKYYEKLKDMDDFSYEIAIINLETHNIKN